MTDRVVIGLKYCGGCSPRYDRILVTNYLKKELVEWVSFVSFEDPNASRILIVAGCETACVDQSPFGSMPVDIITSVVDAKAFVGKIRRNK